MNVPKKGPVMGKAFSCRDITMIDPETRRSGGPLFWSSLHYNDVIMGAMASQITSFTIVYSIVYSGADKKINIKALCHYPLCGEFTGNR